MTDHAKLAQENLDAVHDWQEREGESDASMLTVAIEAQVHATLALEAQTARVAEAQEVTVLVRVAEHLDRVGEPSGEYWDAARVRLHLTPTTPGGES